MVALFLVFDYSLILLFLLSSPQQSHQREFPFRCDSV
jgi:hypothetical protein